MKWKYRSWLGVFALVFLWTQGVSAQDPSQSPPDASAVSISIFTQKTAQADIHAGDVFEWSVTVRWQGNPQPLNPEIMRQPDLEGLEIIRSSTTLRTGATEEEGLYSEKVFQYTFRTLREGQASIGSAAVSYQTDPGASPLTLQTTPETVTVLPERFSFAKWWASMWALLWFKVLWFALILSALTVTCLFWFRTSKAGKPEAAVDEVDPVGEALQHAKNRRIEGDYPGYYAQLEKAVRLRLKTAFPSVSPAGLSGFQDGIPLEIQTVFQRFIQESEEAKYAPVAPSAEALDRAWEDVKRILHTV